jgi:hypothetical protein
MWTLNSIRLIVQANSSGAKQIIARLQPISGGTALQIFGYENPIVKLGAIIVGKTDRDALEALTDTGSSYTLSTPYGSANYYVNSFNSKQRGPGIISQSIILDGSHTCDDPVYDIDLELYI